MALWGYTGHIVRDPFERVVELERVEPKRNPDPNYLQCMSIAYFAVGKPERARDSLEGARQEINRGHSAFSCWRYLYVLKRQFVEDIGEILELIDGIVTRRPRFME